MEYFPLGKSDLKISPLGLGTWAYSGDAWGKCNQNEAIEAIHAALDHGINFIDTAPVYGNGNAETLVGKALQGRQRRGVVIATKCGLVGHGRRGIAHNLTAASIRQEIDGSLVRLQTDYVDLYQCHWPDPKTPIEETLAELSRLRQEGKIRHIGVSNFDLPLLKKAIYIAPLVSLQCQLSLLQRQVLTDLLPFCKDEGIGFLAYGSMAGGILAGKYTLPPKLPGGDARSFFYKFYSGTRFGQVKEFIGKLEALNHPLDQLAINWARQQLGVSCVLVGCRNPKQVVKNMEALNWQLSSAELKAIQTILEKEKG